jgi:cytochrome b6-f complex iron-sulfur subunit
MGRRIVRLISLAVLIASGRSAAYANDETASCKDCHAKQAALHAKSVHATLRCQECHNGEASYSVPSGQLEQFEHRAAAPGLTFDHGTSFIGKPTRLEVPTLCGDCHADVERMNPYGLRTDQLARYKTSVHGKALFGQKDTRVAVCTDCHGPPHEVLAADDPRSHAYPLNVPDTCARCHANKQLMGSYGLPTEVVDEYRRSVHGQLLLEQHDTGAPTCATCHGNHSAMPPGFATVGAVCGQCHEHAAQRFATSVHAEQPGFKGCVQCHGGGEGRHFHLIERITQPTGILIQRYAHLLAAEPHATPQQVREAMHPAPKEIITRTLPTCMECHEDVEDDENLRKMFGLLDEIGDAEREYARTANRLDQISRGVLLVDNQRFEFQDAKTHLIALSPIQHTLDNSLVEAKVAELDAVCDKVNGELDALEAGLSWRRRALWPIWALALGFAVACYVKYRRLKAAYVLPEGAADVAVEAGPKPTRRAFLDWLIGLGSAGAGVLLAIPALMYLWPAARGGGAASAEVEGASALKPGQSLMAQVNGKPVIVIRGRSGFRAFSAVCTHLGCLVKWDASATEFKCPCHAGVFDENGRVVSGPPPSPLPEFGVKEVGEKVYVTT